MRLRRDFRPSMTSRYLALLLFVQSIKEAAAHLGCSDGTISVCHFTEVDSGAGINIIEEYGRVAEARIRTQCVPFVTGATSQQHQAQNQNSKFLVDYTLISLTSDVGESLLVYENDFTISDIKVFGLLWKCWSPFRP